MLEQVGCDAIAKADDIILITSVRFVETIRDTMQLARYKPPLFLPLKLNGAKLKLNNEADFLGFIVDTKLYWKPNIIKIIKIKASIFFNRVLGTKWGLEHRITHWIYTVVVRPILICGCLV